jgi:hypothetical protein
MSFEQDVVRELAILRREVERLKAGENPYPAVLARFLALPGLVGFWPMSSVQRSTGNAYDLSVQGRTLTRNGNPVYNIYNDRAPYLEFDGTGDYLSRADETDLDVLGTETISGSAVRGLTLGGWFYPLAIPGSIQRIFSKGTTTGNDRAYSLYIGTTGTITFYLTQDGAAAYSSASTGQQRLNEWVFVVGRWKPSTEVKIWNNDTTAVSTTSIIPSLFNAAAGLAIGGQADGTALWIGRAALCFLCANAVSDGLIRLLYQHSRVLFGV